MGVCASPRQGCLLTRHAACISADVRPAAAALLPVEPAAGAALYAARLPERLKPGAFDVAFNSHQARGLGWLGWAWLGWLGWAAAAARGRQAHAW